MKLFASLLNSALVAWLIIGGTVLLAITSLFLSTQVVQDDDLLAFLPEGNDDIATFQKINDRFGGMDVALVGIETSNVFDPVFLTQLKEVTKALNDEPTIDYALSLSNVEDFAPDPAGGIRADQLIGTIPKSIEEQKALRTHVFSRDHVVGNMISPSGNAVLLYVFSSYGADARALANTVRELVTSEFETPETGNEASQELRFYWGGAPFISTYIYDTSQQDLTWLSPFAVVVIILIILISFRDWIGSALALFTTLIGVFVSQAAMVVAGVSYNIVLSGMPVILFAVGSAYSIHILCRYYDIASQTDKSSALTRTLTETGPTVLAAGLTTVAGLGSFVAMDIAPMRTFGIFTALGIFTTLILSVTFVPAVIRIVGPRGRAPSEGGLRKWMWHLSSLAQRRRFTVGAALVAVAVSGALLLNRVDNRMD